VAAGARVVVTGRSRATLDDAARRIGGIAIACDVTKLAEVEALFTAARHDTGSVDILVNNAGSSTTPAGQQRRRHRAHRRCGGGRSRGVAGVHRDQSLRRAALPARRRPSHDRTEERLDHQHVLAHGLARLSDAQRPIVRRNSH